MTKQEEQRKKHRKQKEFYRHAYLHSQASKTIQNQEALIYTQ